MEEALSEGVRVHRCSTAIEGQDVCGQQVIVCHESYLELSVVVNEGDWRVGRWLVVQWNRSISISGWLERPACMRFTIATRMECIGYFNTFYGNIPSNTYKIIYI